MYLLYNLLSLIFVLIMSSTNSTTHFNDSKKPNLTSITWIHACNSQNLLNQALNSDVMMIEADIVLGTVNNSGPIIPIMGHPPEQNSDLSLQNFLETVDTFNKQTETLKKGIKLDFKTIEVVRKSVEIVKAISDNATYPVWINADILPGPGDPPTTPVDANEFFEDTKNFTNSVFSVGWTTYFAPSVSNVSYTKEHVQAMLNVIKANGVKQNITFPVRAGIAANSLDQMVELAKSGTLTIWSGATDEVNVEKLRIVIGHIGVDKIYVDVPDDLKNQLHLDDLPTTRGQD